MIWICTLLPACISMKIRYKRNGNKMFSDNTLLELFRWGSWVLVNNLLVMFTVQYLLGIDSVVASAFDSFGFALKYIIIALFFACVLPYILEVGEKYISISLKIGEEEQNK